MEFTFSDGSTMNYETSNELTVKQVKKAKMIKETVKKILNEDISTENALLYAYLDTIAYEIRGIE